MKLTKRLILGSAAMLVGAGAQAADLPVKAKAVEYVKICSLYGAGFYYIPGTDTCLKLGGYLRVDVYANANGFNGYFNGTGAANNRLTNYWSSFARESLSIDTRTATEYGVVRTYANLVYSWAGGGYGGAGTGLTGGATAYDSGNASGAGGIGALHGGKLGVYYAFIQFAGFTMGKAISQFSAPWTNYPGNGFDGLPGGGGTATGVDQLSYTWDFGQGIAFSLSAQDPVQYYQTNLYNVSGATAAGIAGGSYGANDFGGSRAPDLVAMLRIDQAWGLFQASFAAHDNHAGYYGAFETSGHPADKWGWAGQLALSIKNIPTGPGDTVNIQGVYTNGASRYNFQDLATINYSMFGSAGLPGAYQSIAFAAVSDAVFVAGSGLELTTTYGVRGAYTHNWDPHWNTSLYGAWGAVRYNGNAKGYICGGAGMTSLLTAGSTCNPDFDLWVIGTKTDWTPVKNLAFSFDVAYSKLDQKYAGSIAFPGSAAVAKPAGIYEIKNQDTVSVLFRAQRNW